METISYSSLRSNLSKSIDKVNEDHVPLVITRQKGKSAVLMSLEDYKSYEETAYLMQNPANATRISRSIKQLESGGGNERELLE